MTPPSSHRVAIAGERADVPPAAALYSMAGASLGQVLDDAVLVAIGSCWWLPRPLPGLLAASAIERIVQAWWSPYFALAHGLAGMASPACAGDAVPSREGAGGGRPGCA